jgi:hypothetical protein
MDGRYGGGLCLYWGLVAYDGFLNRSLNFFRYWMVLCCATLDVPYEDEVRSLCLLGQYFF